MNRPIVYKPGWSAAPRGIVGRLEPDGKSKPGLLAEFGIAEAKLYFVLAEACKHLGEVRASNVEVMKATGLDDRSLRRAGSRLQEKFKVIEATPADLRHEPLC